MNTDLKSLQFHVTNRCNLNCVFCWKSHENNQSLRDIDSSKILSFCRESCDMKPEEITISGGGEPLLRKNLVLEMIEIIKNSDVRGNLITNGILLDEEICRCLVENEWDEVIFSIQGYNGKMDDKMRDREGTFSKTLKSIERLLRVRNNFETSNPNLRFQVVLTKYNSHNLENYIELADGANVDIVNFRIVNEIERDLSPQINEDFKKQIKKCENLASKKGIDFRREFSFDNKNKDVMCRKPFEELVIFADGRVAPCCVYFDEVENEILDHINNKNLKEIWHGEKFNKFREKIKNKDFPKKCVECFKG